MVKETEFYDLLQVSVSADEGEIRRSYRRLALRYHPDKNPDNPEAAEMFKKIGHAYETLSDADKRKLYDQHGKEGLERGAGGAAFHDASDIFSMFFGGGAPRPRGERKPKDLFHELPVTLAEMYRGKTKRVAVTRNRLCEECGGEGVRRGAQRVTCPQCRGRGVEVRVQQLFPGMMQQVQVVCQRCSGARECTRPSDVCTRCHGQRTVKEKKTLEVVIEKGARRNDVLRFAGEGDQVPGVTLSGDVLILLQQRKHDVFTRVGRHLTMNYAISLQEALCGFDVPVEQLDGRMLLVRVPAGQVVHSEAAWCVTGEGMPLPNTGGTQRGNLYIHFTVDWPTQLPRAQVDKIAAALGVADGKQPRMGGQQVTLQPYKMAASSSSSAAAQRAGQQQQQRGRAAAGRMQQRQAAAAARAAHAQRVNDNEEDDDDDDDDDEEYEDVSGGRDSDDDEEEEIDLTQAGRGGGGGRSGQQYYAQQQQYGPGGSNVHTVQCNQQ